MATESSSLILTFEARGAEKTADGMRMVVEGAHNAEKATENLASAQRESVSATQQYQKVLDACVKQMREVEGASQEAFTATGRFAGEMSRIMKSFGQTSDIEAFSASVRTAYQNFADAIGKMQGLENAGQGLGEQIESITRDLAEMASGAQSGDDAMQDFVKKSMEGCSSLTTHVGELGTGIRELGTGFSGIIPAVAKLGSLVGTVYFAWEGFNQSCLEAKERLDAVSNAYNNAFGARGEQLLSGVREQCEALGLEFQKTAGLASAFFEQGKKSSISNEMDKIFASVIQAGQALSLTDREVSGILSTFGNLANQQTVRFTDLSDKLGKYLPNALEIAAKAMNMTQAELASFAAEGKITADELLPAMAAALKEEYAQAAIEAADTVEGMTNRMATAWEQFKANLASSGPAKFVLQFTTQILEDQVKSHEYFQDRNAVIERMRKAGIKPASQNVSLLGDATPAYNEKQIQSFMKIHEIGKNILNVMGEQTSEINRQTEAAISGVAKVQEQILKSSSAGKIEQKQKEIEKYRADYAIARQNAKDNGASDNALFQMDKTNVDTLAGLNKQLKDLEKNANKAGSAVSGAGKSGASATKSGSAAMNVYASSFKKSHEEALKLEAKLDDLKGASAGEDGRVAIEDKYQAELKETNDYINENLKAGKLTSDQAEAIRQEQNKCAELRKEVALIQESRKAQKENVQIAQGQIKFYKELSQLSGKYTDTLGLQKVLIAQQADEYVNTYGIAKELVDEWVRLQELQYSTDPFDGAYRGLLKFTSEYGDQAKTWEDLTYNFSKSFVDQTGNMFDEFLETGKISLDGFQSLFKSFLKQLAWQAIAQPIMVNIVGSLFGTGGGGAAGAAGLAGVMGGGFTSPITNNGSVVGQMVNGVMQTASSYGTKTLFNQVGGSIVGGITDSINSAVANMFPSMFQETAGGFAGPITNAAGQVVGQSTVSPTFTSALGTAGMGGMIGGMASPFVNSLFGIENNTGSSIGSMGGGLLGTIGGAMAAGSIAGPIGTIIRGAIGALGSLAGGAIGGLLGTQPKQEPKLEVDLVGSLWKPVSGELQNVGGWGDPSSTWDPVTGAFRASAQTSHGAGGQYNIARAYGEVQRQVAEISWGIADSLGAITGDMKTQYLQNLESLGEINVHGIHRGEWINQDNIQAFADWYVGEATGNMLIALSNIDLTPLTIAADGLAVDTVEELSTSLKDVFAAWDMGETIQDEDLKKAYQDKMRELIEAAFADIDLSFLRVNFDPKSFTGLQQAYAAVQAWGQVTESLENVLNPASEFETQMDAAKAQFDGWIDTLRQLGWAEEAIAEIEAKRIDYMKKYQDQLEREMRQNLALRLTALKSGSDSNVYALQSLLFQQANEREQWKSQFGENHELYQAGVRIQHAEFTETLLNQFKAMRDELLAQQKQAEQERIEDEMKALQDRVKAEQDEINARLKALQEEINARQKEISEAEKLADKFRRLAKNLEEYRRNLWTGENNLTGSRYNEAYSQFNDLYQKALTGDEDAFSQLTGKAGELLQLGRDQLPERGEYNDLFYDVDQKLKRAQLYAEQQVSQAERELEILNAQLEAMQKEQEDLNLRLDALQAELQAQQEVLQAQLDAINRNTEETSKIPYTLEQLNSAISYLSGALNTQVGGDSHAGGKTDWERLIAEKVWQLNAGAYQGRTNWTREDFIKAAKESFGSVERWYELAGRQEGFTLKAAQTTNDTLDRNSKTTLKTLNDHNLATNGYLNSQLTEAYAQGANLSSLLYTQEGYWPQAVSGISGLNSGLSSVYSGVTGLNSGLSSIYSGVTGLNGGLSSIYNAVVALGEGGGGSYGGSTGSWGGSSGGNYNGSGATSGIGSQYDTVPLGQGIYGSRYKTENALLTAKARSLNQMKFEGRTDWYPSNVRQRMISACGSVSAWYQAYGRSEGFAEGGVTPSNRIYMVGEEGPELMMSPRQWGVLNNEATDLLFNRPEPQMPVVRPERTDAALLHDIRAGLAEIASYARQGVIKTDKLAYSCQKMKDKLDKWDNDGLPHETSEVAA